MRFALPDPQIAPLVSAINSTEVKPAKEEQWVEDVMLPNWANLWFSDGSWQVSKIDVAYSAPAPSFA